MPRAFYDRPTAIVAAELIGKVLVRQIASDGKAIWAGGRIVETEAYLATGDLASHSQRGQTKSNASMFARPGTAYVYPIHAKHCFNVATEAAGNGSAVLIRAIEPIWDLDGMKSRRSQTLPNRLTSGPAMICQALAIDRDDDGTDLINDRHFRIATMNDTDDLTVRASPRIGISKSAELPLRFFVLDNPFVSGPKRDKSS